MPAAIPLLVYYGATALGVGSLIAGALTLGSSIAIADRQRRKANRAARAAWEASLRDRAITVRGAELPRSITYGRVKIGGELVYARSFGSLQDRLLMVVALRSGHELDAIEQVFMGERSLGTLDVNGYPTDGPFVTSRSDNTDTVNSTANGGATRVVTLPNTPISGSVTAQYATGSSGGDNGPAYEPLTIAGVSGNDVTVNTVGISGNLANGTAIYVQYLYAQTGLNTWVRCKRYLGTDTQTADADAITDSAGEWTSNHRGRGVPCLYLWFQFNENLFPSGIENISAIVRGRKVYDPRTTTTVYSRNPALIARDYLTSSLGFGCSAGEIDDTLVIAAANECDEWVDLYNTGTISVNNGSNVVTGSGTDWKDWIQGQFFIGPDAVAYEIAGQFSATELRLYSAYGGTNASGASYVIRHRRYTCDVDLSTETARDENLQIILDAMAGFCVYSQGKWRIYAGAYTSPAVTLDESFLADSESIAIQARVPRAQLFNAVKGVYLSEKNAWQVADYPLVSNSTYETQDGGERMVAEVNLPATNDAWMAQRLAKIQLERARQALTVRAAFNLKAYAVTPGDIIGLTLSRYGFSNKAMRVIDREFDLARGVVLTLREEASGVYDWAFGEATEVDLAPNTNLPSPWTAPTMPAITLATGDSHVLVTGDGTVVPRIRASWSALTDAGVTQGGYIEVEYRSLPATAWAQMPALPGDATQVYIGPVVERAQYQVRARAVNGVGVRSEWQSAAITITSTVAPPAPTSLTVSTVNNLRRFTIGVGQIPLSLAGFEIRYQSGGSITWASATVLGTFGYTPGATAPFAFESATPGTAGTYSFEVRAINSARLVSATGAQALNQTLAALKQVVAYLTSEAAVLSADVNGTVSDFGPATTTMKVLVDGVDESASWSYSRVEGVGITSSVGASTGILTVSAMSAEATYIDITAARSGYPSVTKRFNVAKARQGVTGTPGAPGDPGTPGTPGTNGTNGVRGSRWFYVSGQSSWSDSVANSAASADGGPIAGDLVTQYNTTAFAQTRQRQGDGSWAVIPVVIDGNLLVDGTVTAEAFTTNLKTDQATRVRNSDFTDYAGRNDTIAALPGWGIFDDGVTAPIVVGRNIFDGSLYNIGRGGAWLRIPNASTNSKSVYLYQDLPAQAGVTYEFHYSGSLLLGRAGLLVEWRDGSNNIIGYGVFGEVDANGSGLGNAYAPGVLLWASGTAPTNTATARILLYLKEATSTGSDSYLFMHRVHFAPLVAGASATNPTPWKPAGSVEIHGGAITADTLEVNALRAGAINASRYIQSSNYAAGSAGFRLHGDGSAEFRNVLVRGDVQATSLNGNNIVDVLNMVNTAVSEIASADNVGATEYDSTTLLATRTWYGSIVTATTRGYPKRVAYSFVGFVIVDLEGDSSGPYQQRLRMRVQAWDEIQGTAFGQEVDQEMQVTVLANTRSRFRLPFSLASSTEFGGTVQTSLRPRFDLWVYDDWANTSTTAARIRYVYYTNHGRVVELKR